MPRTGPSTPPPPDDPRTLGERIRAVRMGWGWTQTELGQALNTDQTAVSTWERDKARPSGAALAVIAQLFNLPLSALEDDTGPFKVPPRPESTPSEPFAVQLAPLPSGCPVLVDLAQDTRRPLLNIQEVFLQIIEAERHGRQVWVVLK